jgi:hypothetical protein
LLAIESQQMRLNVMKSLTLLALQARPLIYFLICRNQPLRWYSHLGH